MCHTLQDIPTDANSHQHHVLAITRNLRRFYGARLVRASLLLQNSQNETHLLNAQLERERLEHSEMAISSVISRIEEKEENERQDMEMMNRRQRNVKYLKIFSAVFAVIVGFVIYHAQSNQ